MSDLIRTLKEVAHYPPHPPRKPTALYTRTHHHLVVEEDRPCLVCGVRNSILSDAAKRADEALNPWGATAIETHHHIIEDSLANWADRDAFNRKVVPAMLKRSGNAAKYGHPFTQDEMLEWIHGDEDHMWCLCDVHHRHPLVGIHAITYPVWSAQDLLIKGSDLTGYHPHNPVEAAQLAALPVVNGPVVP